MKKIFLTLALILSAVSTAFAYQIQAGTQTQRLERGTKIGLEMAESVTSTDFETGDMFSATIREDVNIDKNTILPKGSLIRGSVGKIIPSKRLSRAANLSLTFDHVVTPQGRQLPIRAMLCSHFRLTPDGSITTGGNYGTALVENWDNTIDYVQRSTQWGLNAGDKLFPGATIITTPVGAIGGTIFGVGYIFYETIADLFKKGDEVIINQGEKFDIMLLDYLDVPINQ